MKKKTLALLMLVASASSLAQDRLVIRPDAGAFPVGTAQDLSYSLASIRVTRVGPSIRVSNPASQATSWSLELRPPTGIVLAAGCYERARRFAVATRPAMDFSFGSSGCNVAYGRFRILEIEANAGGDITKLAVDFNQQCEQYGRAVAGQIRFNSTLPISVDSHRAVIDPSGTFSFVAATGAIGGTAPGGTANFTLSRATSVMTSNFDNGASLAYSGPLPGGSNGNWRVDLAAPGDVPLAVASYPVATRFPFQLASEAGLDFSYGGAGCNTLQGSFSVSNVLMDGLDNVPLALNATFNQRCPNAAGPLTQGTIAYTGNLIGPSSAASSDQLMKSGFESGETPPSSSSFYSATCN